MIRYRRLGRTNLQVSQIDSGGGFAGGMLALADDDTLRLEPGEAGFEL